MNKSIKNKMTVFVSNRQADGQFLLNKKLEKYYTRGFRFEKENIEDYIEIIVLILILAGKV